MHSLCIADQLGVFNSIELIAKTLHGGNQPPPPPYVSYPKPRQSSKSQQSAGLASESNSVTTGKESLEAVGITSKLNDNTCSEESEEEYLNSAQSGEKRFASEKWHQEYGTDSLDSDGQSHSRNVALLQLCHTSTDPESSSSKLKETASAGMTLMEGADGLRRRRKTEENTYREKLSSKARDLDSKKKVDRESAIDTSKTFRNIYYGIGAGTFLY